MKKHGVTQRRIRFAATGLLVVLAASGAVAAAATGLSPINEHLLQIFETTSIPGGGTLPPVVATVGSTQISSVAFARQVAIVRDNNSTRNLGMTVSQIRATAMNNLIRDAALYERAKSEHITVSETELQTFIQDQKRLLVVSESANPDVAARTNAVVAANGDSTRDAYWANPNVIEEYRRMLMKGKLVKAHVGPSASQEALEAFIKSVVASADVHILIAV